VPRVAGAEHIRTHEGKTIHFLHPRFAAQLAASLHLKAILLPLRDVTAGIHPVSRGEAMGILTASSAKLWPMPARRFQAGLGIIAQLVRTTPCWRVSTGHGVAHAVQAVREILERKAV